MPTKNGRIPFNFDPPVKNLYGNPQSRYNQSTNYRQPSQENPNGVRYVSHAHDDNHNSRPKSRAMRNVSLLADANKKNNQLSMTSRYLNTPALRKSGDPSSKPATRSSSRLRASSVGNKSQKLKSGGATNRVQTTESQIKSLQKELDEVKFFREIEETGMEAQKASEKSHKTYPIQHSQHHDSSLQQRLYENELQIKTLNLQLQSSKDENLKLAKKVKLYKDGQEKIQIFEEKIKTLEKQSRSAKKTNSCLEEKASNLERAIESQKQHLKQKTKLEQRMKKKEEDVVALEKEIQKQKKHNKTLDKQINSCIETIQVAEEQLANSRKQESNLQKLNADLELHLTEKDEDLKRKDKEYKDKQNEIISLQEQVEEISSKSLELRKQLQAKETECARKEEELHALAEEAEATTEKANKAHQSVLEIEATNESLRADLKKQHVKLADLNNVLEETRSILSSKDIELEEKKSLIEEERKISSSLEKKYNVIKEMSESNKVILEMRQREAEKFKKEYSDQKLISQQEMIEKDDLKIHIKELTLKIQNLELSISKEQQAHNAENIADKKSIHELSQKLTQVKDELDETRKSKEEALAFSQSRSNKIERELRQSLATSQKEITRLEGKIIKDETEKDSILKKHDKQVLEMQKKIDEATQKLIDTMSSSLANGRELEEYRSKVSDSEAQNIEKIRTLQQSVDERKKELEKSKETIDQYNQVAEKLCIEIEETKYHHELEIEDLKASIETLKGNLEIEHSRNLEETQEEISHLKKQHANQIQELQSTLEELTSSVEKYRSRQQEMSLDNESLEAVFLSFHSKVSKIPFFNEHQMSILNGERKAKKSITHRFNDLSDAIKKAFAKLEEALTVLESDARAKDQEIEELKRAYQKEVSSLKEKLNKCTADFAKCRVITNSIQSNESELRKTLSEEKEKLKKAISEIETLTTLSLRSKEKYNSMKSRSDSHIAALHTALEDSKADIAQLEAVLRITNSSREKTFSSNSELKNTSKKLQIEKSSLMSERSSLHTAMNSCLSNVDNSTRMSKQLQAQNFREDSKYFGNTDISVGNLSSNFGDYPDDECEESSYDSNDVQNIELDALTEFMSIRTQRIDEI